MRYFHTLWSNDAFHFPKILFTDGAIITNLLFHQQIIKINNLIINEFVKFQYVVCYVSMCGRVICLSCQPLFNIFLSLIGNHHAHHHGLSMYIKFDLILKSIY